MIRTELKIDSVTSVLAETVRRLDDMAPAFQDIGELMVSRTEGNFDRGQSPDGQPWAPKSETTKKRQGYKNSDRPLHFNLFLRNSIAYEADASGVEWGSNLIQAAVMQLGAAKGSFGTNSKGQSLPWGDIPARPFLGVGADDETAILETLQEYLQTADGD